jgi:hypothetical protein
MLVTQPVRYRLGRQPRRVWVFFLEPVGEYCRFGDHAGFDFTSIPSGAVFRLN